MSRPERVVQTPRLLLSPWSEDDREIFTRLASDPRVMRYIGSGDVWTPERINDVFTRQLNHWEEHGFGWRSVVEKESGDGLGFVGLNYLDPEVVEIPQGGVEIGWWLAPSAWGRGYATEGARSLRDEGFDRVGLAHMIGRYRPANQASGRIMERLGMTFERDVTDRFDQIVRIHGLDRVTWAALKGASI